MILHWPFLKKCLVLAGTMILLLPEAKADVCSEKREPSEDDLFGVETISALIPGYRFNFDSGKRVTIEVKEGTHDPGLAEHPSCSMETKIYGYAAEGEEATWPGKTFEVKKAVPHQVTWVNDLQPGPYILTGADNSLADFSSSPVVDTSLHWAYSLKGKTCSGSCNCSNPTFDTCGTPQVVHLHGGQTDYENDGNPEFFFGPNDETGKPLIQGPQYKTNVYRYPNNLDATSIWYHDHALGITRLNVYAGLAGFYFVRDNFDTGKAGNKLTVPAGEYELALAIQDRMFKNNGELLYPAFPGDPGYEGFITDEGVVLNDSTEFPGGECVGGSCGPTALAEFFGDHMVVNGKVWPKMNVEPRNYRLRLLNGCDSRFLAVQFCIAGPASPDPASPDPASPKDCEDDSRIPFYVIGGDQGLAPSATKVQETLLMETGSRYDIIFDFTSYADTRIIMKNVGGDEPFGGELPGPTAPGYMDRIMAFDVTMELNANVADVFNVATLNKKLAQIANIGGPPKKATRYRKVALFEGTDEFGRLQPLLGTAQPATDYKNVPIIWPDTEPYNKSDVNLIGQMEGTMTWHEPITENPKFQTTEIWEIWNVSGDAHPIHLHLVKFEVVDRQKIKWDSALKTTCGGIVCDFGVDGFEAVLDPTVTAKDDGIYLVEQKTVQYNGELGSGFKIVFPSHPNDYYDGEPFILTEPYVENHSKDIVTALPGQVTRIKVTFTKKGRYVWHCHILSHEDHEMMRVMFVGDESAVNRNLRGDCEQVGEA